MQTPTSPISRPSAFCTISTRNCADECFGLLLSIAKYHRNSVPVFVRCDTATYTQLTTEVTPKLSDLIDIRFVTALDRYSGLNRIEMERRGIWSDFQMEKSLAIDHVFSEGFRDCCFLDSDILLLNPIEHRFFGNKNLVVSPHYICKRDTDRFGQYNGGFLYTRDPQLGQRWREYTRTSRFYDQASIEDLVRYENERQERTGEGGVGELGQGWNFSWWRIEQGDIGPAELWKQVGCEGGQIMYRGEPVVFVHTHFHERREFNKRFLMKLVETKRTAELVIIGRIVNGGKWNVILPNTNVLKNTRWHHDGDSFRELATMWGASISDVNTNIVDGELHCWLVPRVLLQDRPTPAWLFEDSTEASLVLLGNGSVSGDEGRDIRDHIQGGQSSVLPWIFWGRRPRLLEEAHTKTGNRGWDERQNSVVFIGNYENPVQERYRTQFDWSSVVDDWHCSPGNTHRFTQEEYLRKIADAKQGLCIRGYGSKCHREVELMGVGTVPIVTDAVEMDSYADPPIEGTHYIRVNNPAELREKLGDIDDTKWTSMSMACREWWDRNCSRCGSWETTIRMSLFGTPRFSH